MLFRSTCPRRGHVLQRGHRPRSRAGQHIGVSAVALPGGIAQHIPGGIHLDGVPLRHVAASDVHPAFADRPYKLAVVQFFLHLGGCVLCQFCGGLGGFRGGICRRKSFQRPPYGAVQFRAGMRQVITVHCSTP